MAQKFKKGVDPRRNTEGRPKGKPNRTTEQLRKMLQTFVEGKTDELEMIWKQLEPKDKANFLNQLLRHTLPAPVQDISQFSEDDIDLLINRLRQQQNKTLN